ncbi:MAG: hypothetical protein ACKKMP_00340 [Candidatus Nealsonbacteria bacterium]
MKKKKKLESKKVKEIIKTEIKIERNDFSGQTSIIIPFSNGEIDKLWHKSVATRLFQHKYSQEQAKDILEGSKSFLERSDKVPQIFNEIIKELEESIRKME